MAHLGAYKLINAKQQNADSLKRRYGVEASASAVRAWSFGGKLRECESEKEKESESEKERERESDLHLHIPP